MGLKGTSRRKRKLTGQRVRGVIICTSCQVRRLDTASGVVKEASYLHPPPPTRAFKKKKKKQKKLHPLGCDVKGRFGQGEPN